MLQSWLGVLVFLQQGKRKMEEQHIYEKMTIAGQQIGLNVCVIHPADVNYATNKVNALIYLPSSQKWTRKWMNIPPYIFDRCRSSNRGKYHIVRKFRMRYSHLTYLNSPLRNKWLIYNVLREQPAFQAFLPNTILFNRASDIKHMMNKYGMVYVKPASGTGGRGILRIEHHSRHPRHLFVEGRDRYRHIIKPQYVNFDRLGRYMYTWVKQERYIVQQGIEVKLPNGRVHDVRMLVQKNEVGMWTLTGTVGRVGARQSVTSNLHGGGRAVPMRALLERWIGDNPSIYEIESQLERAGIQIAKYLEMKYGSLCELALDWAIDKNGRHWLLEVNPKPSREAFQNVGDEAAYHKAITKPIHYAKWIMTNKHVR
ncbi:YheC/YheD family protein [Paenibacillus arenosi]|uniref:YheC/YheD family protein n=1 Tax=Paenibacillus arenosi TaxID=2774142 RepID=A0ABR9AS75_9BACL|nr:YheC/YheD family protein [Paenibacillus arenosi]MBD8496960.1 YheC/YheD family protein [Paenibacillus arenosi]